MNIEKDVESILVSEEELDRITTRLAAEITEDYKDSPRKLLILSILKGSLIFTADLIRKISLPLTRAKSMTNENIIISSSLATERIMFHPKKPIDLPRN